MRNRLVFGHSSFPIIPGTRASGRSHMLEAKLAFRVYGGDTCRKESWFKSSREEFEFLSLFLGKHFEPELGFYLS